MRSMKPSLPSLLVALALLIPPPAQADLPDLGDVSEATLSAAEEARIGAELMRAMRDSGEATDDPDINAYLNDLGGRLAQSAQMPGGRFTFFSLNDRSINAFAMPGGYIGVHSGLVLTTQSESELASVMAHEIAHVTQHHLARMQASAAPNQLVLLAAILAGALAAKAGGGSDAAFGALNAGLGLTVASQLAYSRDFEREADRVGMQYLANAGFDVRAMPLFMERLQNANRLNDNNNALAFLRTHPVTVERISEAQNRLSAFGLKMRADSPDYLLVREKLRLAALGPDEAVRYYRQALANRQFLSEGAQWYGLARALLAQKDLEAARRALDEARNRLPDHPMLWSLGADIARSAGDETAARAAYRNGLARYPSNRSLYLGEIGWLIERGQTGEAEKRLRLQLGRTPSDSALYRLQARLYADRDRLRYHSALANALYFEGNAEAALEQYRLAGEAPGDDFYLRSSNEARMRELERRIRETPRPKKGRS